MKSNVKREGSTNEIVAVTVPTEQRIERGFRQRPKQSEIIAVIKQKIQSDYEETLKEFGERRIVEVLNSMLLQGYINRFNPKDTRKIAKMCVIKFVARFAVSHMEQITSEKLISSKNMEQLESELVTIQKISSLQEEKELKKKIDEIARRYRKEIMTRKGIPQNQMDDQDDKENKEEQVERKNKKKTGGQVAKKTPKKKVVASSHSSSKKKNEDVLDKAEEVRYYESVQKYTKNFSFLVEDPIVYFSRKGTLITSKFASFSEYDRFHSLREKIVQIAQESGLGEHKAIQRLLEEAKLQKESEDERKEITLKPADKKILTERLLVLDREKPELER